MFGSVDFELVEIQIPSKSRVLPALSRDSRGNTLKRDSLFGRTRASRRLVKTKMPTAITQNKEVMKEVERPQAGTRKIHSRNEFELCYIRHQYFRRVKYNPTAEEMAPYRQIIRSLGLRTYYTYPKLFHIVGMTADDVQAIANIHLVNFIGLFEISPTKNVKKYNDFIRFISKKSKAKPLNDEILDKNKAILTCFLKQRLEDLVRICKQKAKNIKGLRVDEYIPFYGPQPPPRELFKLLEDNKAYGYKRADSTLFKSFRKKAKAKHGETFQFAGYWYVPVPTSQRPLTYGDLEGAGFDPRDNEHNMNPEQILIKNSEEIRIDKKIKIFKNGTKEERTKIILAFLEKNADDPAFREEIFTARKMLKTLGHIDVG